MSHVRHALRGVGGRMRRIELGCGEHAGPEAALDFRRGDVVGQIGRHQRCEGKARRERPLDPRTIGFRRGHGGHRRIEVGHDDRPGELTGGLVDDGGEHPAVTEMHMPIIGLAKD